MHIFEKMSQSALNHVLILQKDRTQKMLQIPLKIIDLQNDFNILVAKQWKIRISVPMSYIKFIITIFFYSIIMIHNPIYNYSSQSDLQL